MVIEQQAVQAAREGIDEPVRIEPVTVPGGTGFLTTPLNCMRYCIRFRPDIRRQRLPEISVAITIYHPRKHRARNQDNLSCAGPWLGINPASRCA